jgi:hypothetical protein
MATEPKPEASTTKKKKLPSGYSTKSIEKKMILRERSRLCRLKRKQREMDMKKEIEQLKEKNRLLERDNYTIKHQHRKCYYNKKLLDIAEKL